MTAYSPIIWYRHNFIMQSIMLHAVAFYSLLTIFDKITSTIVGNNILVEFLGLLSFIAMVCYYQEWRIKHLLLQTNLIQERNLAGEERNHPGEERSHVLGE